MGTRLDPTRRTVEGLTAPAVRLLHLSRTRVRCSAKWLESTPVGVLWSRMLEVEFVDRSVALAAKLFVSFFPLLVIAAALARDTVRETMVAAVMDRLGVSGGALDLVQQAFATPEATRAATGAVGVLLTVAFAVSFTTALQRAYLRAWRRPSGGGLRNKGRGALWVGGALVYLMTLAFASKLIGGDIGAVGAWLAGVAVGTLLWWWSRLVDAARRGSVAAPVSVRAVHRRGNLALRGRRRRVDAADGHRQLPAVRRVRSGTVVRHLLYRHGVRRRDRRGARTRAGRSRRPARSMAPPRCHHPVDADGRAAAPRPATPHAPVGCIRWRFARHHHVTGSPCGRPWIVARFVPAAAR